MTTTHDIPWYWNPVGLFDGAEGARAPFLASAERLDFKRGKTVFGADDRADHVFFLERGTVKIYHLGAQGEVAIFWFCLPGDLFGAGGLAGAERQSVFAQATERSVVYALARPAFEAVLRAHPQLALNVLKLVGGRLRLACDAVADKAMLRADARLARVLLRQAQQWAKPDGTALRFGAAVTHQELANMVGATRQTVNRILKGFQRQGWLDLDGRHIVLLDGAALRQVASF